MTVTEDNDHLGQVVSGVCQEQKNVDTRIAKGRKNLFGMLGPAFAYKCQLSPVVKLHLFRTYTCPIHRVEKSREHRKHARGTLRDFPGTLKP